MQAHPLRLGRVRFGPTMAAQTSSYERRLLLPSEKAAWSAPGENRLAPPHPRLRHNQVGFSAGPAASYALPLDADPR